MFPSLEKFVCGNVGTFSKNPTIVQDSVCDHFNMKKEIYNKMCIGKPKMGPHENYEAAALLVLRLSNFCLCAIARILSNKLHDVIIRRSYIRASTKSVFATWLYNVSITGNLIRPWTSVLIITQFKPLHNLICLSLLSIQTGSVNTPWLRPPTLASFEVAREAEPHHARTHTPVSITTARPVEAFPSPTNHSDLSAFILW